MLLDGKEDERPRPQSISIPSRRATTINKRKQRSGWKSEPLPSCAEVFALKSKRQGRNEAQRNHKIYNKRSLAALVVLVEEPSPYGLLRPLLSLLLRLRLWLAPSQAPRSPRLLLAALARTPWIKGGGGRNPSSDGVSAHLYL